MSRPNNQNTAPVTTPGSPSWMELPGHAKSYIYALHSQLLFTQWMAPEIFNTEQAFHLEVLLRFAGKYAPHYRESLKRIIQLPDRGLNDHHFQNLPLLSRHDLQQREDYIVIRKRLENHGMTRTTTVPQPNGRPVEIMTTDLVTTWNRAITLRCQDWHGYDVSLNNLNICDPIRQGVNTPDRWSELPWSGPSTDLSIDRPVEDLFNELIRIDPYYLQTRPSILRSLVELSVSRGIKPQNLREVRCRCEHLDRETRDRVEKAWGVSVIHILYTPEIGTIALQCPESTNLHIQSEYVKLEILNDDDLACSSGQVGRLVATSLHNYRMPLIRFDTGIQAEAAATCQCGRTLPVLTHMPGRNGTKP